MLTFWFALGFIAKVPAGSGDTLRNNPATVYPGKMMNRR